MQTKIIEKYFFFSLLFITFIFSFFIFRPFWIVLILSISFSIVFHPVYEWLTKIKLPNWLASLLTVLLFVLIVCGLLFGIGVIVFNQSQSVYNLVINNEGSTFPFIDSLNNSIAKILPSGISFDLNEKISTIISIIASNITNVFTSTFSTIFSFFLTFLSMFYFLKDSTYWKNVLMKMSPLSDINSEKILEKISQSVNGIIKGNLFIVFIQGLLVCIGFFIFGVPNPALWGLVAMVCGFIPTIGSGLVSIPAIIFLLITGQTMPALGLTIWAIAMVGTIDNILNPIIVGKKINLPPLLILFAVLGGISLLGPVGILIGPLTISLFYTLISIYREEFKQELANQ